MRLNKSQSKMSFSKNKIIKGAINIQIKQKNKGRGMLDCEYRFKKGS